jgi:predicted deacylase
LEQKVFEFADLTVAPGERAFTRLPVTQLLTGGTLSLPVHVVNGAAPGPVLGMTSAVHGAEYLPIRMVREGLASVNPAQLKGTIVAISVCNPLSFARGTRISPDEDDIDFANLNRVFPGRRTKAVFGIGRPPESDRALTEMMASVITEQFLPKINYLIDFHCHYNGAGLNKMIQPKDQKGRQAEMSKGMARAFAVGLIHEHDDNPKTLTGQAAQMGISSCCAEAGGGGLSLPVEEQVVQGGVRGILNICKFLGMLPGEMELPKRQLVFEIAPHIRPTTAGYLISRFDPERLFTGAEAGVPVKKGEVLGTLFDPYTFKDLEQLTSPVDGILYITRRSGPVEAGCHAYAVVDMSGSHWIS